MKLEDLQESISQMSTADLEDALREIRHNRTSENVVAKKEKTAKARVSEIDLLLKHMSPADLAKLMEGL